ncbi:MAG: hypothetical protein QOF73_3692 [Thermomicrobiales bacterium]|jgi:hypothetical protein|nr:hypothetical protein [Thermomicrobiales bacterium]
MEHDEGGSRWKLWAILGGLGTLIVFGLIIWGLYSLGDDDQSALERFRDIAVIFVILLFLMTVVLLAAITAALGYLVLQIKDRVIPLLEELNGTLKRFHGTANFVTEEAVKPIITVASSYAKVRATMKTVAGRNGKKK